MKGFFEFIGKSLIVLGAILFWTFCAHGSFSDSSVTIIEIVKEIRAIVVAGTMLISGIGILASLREK